MAGQTENIELVFVAETEDATRALAAVSSSTKRLNPSLVALDKTLLKLGESEAQRAKAALANLAVSKQTGQATPLVAQAFAELAKETQDSAVAGEHVAMVFDIQAATGINKSKDAAKALGDVLGGGTKLLRQFDGRAASAAAAIDKIKDPAKRAELGMVALRQAIARQNSALGRAKARVTEFNAKLSMMGLGPNPLGAAAGGVAALAAGMVALGAAVSGVVLSSILKFAKSQETTSFAVDSLKTRIGELQIAFGKAALGAGDASTVFQSLELVVLDMTTEIQDSSSGINIAFTSTVRVLEFLLLVAIDKVAMSIKELTMVIDVVQITFFKFTQTLSGAASALDGVIRRINAVVDSDALSRFSDGVRRISMELESDAPTVYSLQVDKASSSMVRFTNRIADALVGTREINDELAAIKAVQEALRGVGKAQKDATRTRAGSGRKKTPASDLLKELAGEIAAEKRGRAELAKERLDAIKKEAKAKNDAVMAEIAILQKRRRLEHAMAAPGKRQRAREEEARQKELNAALERGREAWIAFNAAAKRTATDGLQSVTMAMADTIGMMAMGEASLADLGKTLINGLADLAGQIAPLLLQLGWGLIGIQTGNAVLIIAAAVALRAISGAIRSFSMDKSAAGSSAGSGSRSTEALARQLRQGEETPVVNEISIMLGTEKLDAHVEERVYRLQSSGALGSLVRSSARRGVA